MKDLNFNTQAFVNPKTPKEYMAVLDEALHMAEDLGIQIDRDTSFLTKNVTAISE